MAAARQEKNHANQRKGVCMSLRETYEKKMQCNPPINSCAFK